MFLFKCARKCPLGAKRPQVQTHTERHKKQAARIQGYMHSRCALTMVF